MDQPNGQPAPPASESVQRVADAAQSAVDKTKDMAQEQIQAGANQVVSSANAAAGALRRAADDVANEHAWIGSILRKSADGLESASQSLRGGNLEGAVRDLNGFARRQPTLFLGGGFAIGFALARVGKTAIEHASDNADASAAPASSISVGV